jgi:hypothetical protein
MYSIPARSTTELRTTMSETTATLSPAAIDFDILSRKSRPTLRRASTLTLELKLHGNERHHLRQKISLRTRQQIVYVDSDECRSMGIRFLGFESDSNCHAYNILACTKSYWLDYWTLTRALSASGCFDLESAISRFPLIKRMGLLREKAAAEQGLKAPPPISNSPRAMRLRQLLKRLQARQTGWTEPAAPTMLNSELRGNHQCLSS